jgi:malate permease and related proteins
MEQILLILSAIVPVYTIVGIGGFLRQSDILTKVSDKGVMQIVVHLLTPCLILDKTIGHPVMKDAGIVFSSIGVGFGILLISTVIAYFAGGFLGLKRGSGKRTFAVSTSIQNYGYLAIPMIEAVFPDDGAISVLFVHNIGIELAVWTVSLMLLTGFFSISFKTFFKGPIIGVFLGILINFSGLSTEVPGPLLKTFEMLGACTLPIALLLIGTSLHDLWGKEKINWAVCAGACVTRLCILPAMILGLVYVLPISIPLKQVLIVQAAMPAGMFPIILARYYQGQVGIAAQITLATSVISIVTMPLLLFFGLKLLD